MCIQQHKLFRVTLYGDKTTVDCCEGGTTPRTTSGSGLNPPRTVDLVERVGTTDIRCRCLHPITSNEISVWVFKSIPTSDAQRRTQHRRTRYTQQNRLSHRATPLQSRTLKQNNNYKWAITSTLKIKSHILTDPVRQIGLVSSLPSPNNRNNKCSLPHIQEWKCGALH